MEEGTKGEGKSLIKSGNYGKTVIIRGIDIVMKMIEETLIKNTCGGEGGGGGGSGDMESRREGWVRRHRGQREKKFNKSGNNRQTVIDGRIDIETKMIEETLIYNICEREGGGGGGMGDMEGRTGGWVW